MRRGTFIAIVVLFVGLAVAAVTQLTLGHRAAPLQGPQSPGNLPPVVNSGIAGSLLVGSGGGALSPSSGTILVFEANGPNELTEAPIHTDGAFRIALPPGRYRLEIRLPGQDRAAARRLVDVREQQFTPVVFRLPVRSTS